MSWKGVERRRISWRRRGRGFGNEEAWPLERLRVVAWVGRHGSRSLSRERGAVGRSRSRTRRPEAGAALLKGEGGEGKREGPKSAASAF